MVLPAPKPKRDEVQPPAHKPAVPDGMPLKLVGDTRKKVCVKLP